MTGRVVVLVQRPDTWVNVRAVVEELVGANAGPVEVWALPYDVGKPDVSAAKAPTLLAALEADRAPSRTWNDAADFAVRADDVVVFTTPYDTERPPALYFDAVAKRARATAYLPYGLVLAGGVRNLTFQMHQAVATRATVVFARSERERAVYAEWCPTGATHVRVTGLPRMDQLLPGRFEPDPALLEAIGDRFPVLWNSHFSYGLQHLGSTGYSTLDRMAGVLLGYAAARPELALLWRPHPRVIPELIDDGLLTRGEVEALRRELDAAGVILDQRADHLHVFAASKALLTDAGSFLLEYVATKKPLVYLRNPDSEGLTEEGDELVAHLVNASTPDQVLTALDALLAGQALPQTDPEQLVAEFLPWCDGRSAERVAAVLLELAGEGTAANPPADAAERSVLAAPPARLQAAASTAIPAPPDAATYPILHRVCAGLSAIQAKKRAAPRWKRWLLRKYYVLRTRLAVRAKRYGALLRWVAAWRRRGRKA